MSEIKEEFKQCNKNNCNGKLFNILVFCERANEINELLGDIVKVCDCPDCWDNYKTLAKCIQNTSIQNLENVREDIEEKEYNKKINDIMNSIANFHLKKGTILHAIARVNCGLKQNDEDFIETNILWKSEFAREHKLRDTFLNTDFGVAY